MSKAVVVGGTGAVGQHVVGQLLQSGAWEKVVTVGRREVTLPSLYDPASFKAQLEQVTVNMDNLLTEGKEAFNGASAVFCCLGTTRKDAGSVEAFRKVDLTFVEQAAQAAKQGGTAHFALVSSQGANASTWANDWYISAPLMYMKTKGQAEEAVKALNFTSTSIFRPGMLGREEMTRAGLEKTAAKFMNALPVSQLAKLMILDAAQAPSMRPKVGMFDNDELHRAAKEGGPARPA